MGHVHLELAPVALHEMRRKNEQGFAAVLDAGQDLFGDFSTELKVPFVKAQPEIIINIIIMIIIVIIIIIKIIIIIIMMMMMMM